MKSDTKSILKGIGTAAAFEAVGAVIGSVSNPSCDNPQAPMLCGPGAGALLGGITAGGLSQMIGLGFAVFSPKRRLLGIGMAVGPMVLGVVESAGLAVVRAVSSPSAGSISITPGQPAQALPGGNAAAVASGAAATAQTPADV